MNSSTELRRLVRAARRNLNEEARRNASGALAARIRRLAVFQSAEQIGAFLAFDGEIDPAPLVAEAWASGKRVYLPIIGRDDILRFGRYRDDTPLAPNRFGIPEPGLDADEVVTASGLDLVLTPLVAFDGEARRMGMGGGFYDRSFAFVREEARDRHPTMLGVAYELQKQDHLHANPWDVPLDGVATEAGLYLRPGQTRIH